MFSCFGLWTLSKTFGMAAGLPGTFEHLLSQVDLVKVLPEKQIKSIKAACVCLFIIEKEP